MHARAWGVSDSHVGMGHRVESSEMNHEMHLWNERSDEKYEQYDS